MVLAADGASLEYESEPMACTDWAVIGNFSSDFES